MTSLRVCAALVAVAVAAVAQNLPACQPLRKTCRVEVTRTGPAPQPALYNATPPAPASSGSRIVLNSIVALDNSTTNVTNRVNSVLPPLLNIPMCPLPRKPCRVEVTYSKGRIYGRFVQQVMPPFEDCACPDASCASYGHYEPYLMRRKLRHITTAKTQTLLKMVFCERIADQSQHVCDVGQESLELQLASGVPLHLTTPTVVRHPCVCSWNRPLMLHRTSFGMNNSTNFVYMCGYHKPYCTADTSNRCMTCNNTNGGCHFHCKCRQRRSCEFVPGQSYGRCV